MSKSKVIVLTGATQGLGRALAKGFAEEGHTVLGCGRSKRNIQSLAKELGDRHDFDVVDVTDDNVVKDWAKRLIKKFGPPDILINNAALINKNAPLWEVPVKEFSDVVDVNIKGVTNTIRHFVPAMVKRKSGVIVNLSSGWGRSTSPDVAPYCATKWAIEGLSKGLADDLPSGMASIPLNPGVINTEMLQNCFGPSASSYPDPDEWAESAVPMILKLGPRDNGSSLSV